MAFRYYILSFLLCCSSLLCAQDVKFSASASATQVATNDPFEITFTINGNGRFTPPDFSGFQIVGGPNQSTSMSSINGVTTYSMAYSYDLVATSPGTFTIGQATLVVGGKQYTTNPIKITVIKGRPAPRNNQNAQQQQDQQDLVAPEGKPADINKSLMIRADVSKSNVYQGEQILVTYKLYTRVALVGSEPEKLPDLNGFWSTDIKTNPQQAPQWRTEFYKGQQYNVVDLKQTLIFPQRAGNLSIDPLSMSFIVREQAPARSIVEQFFGNTKDVKYKIKSPAVTIHVKPLPDAGKPAGFTGAVGTYTISASTDKKELKANEALNYRLIVSGSGNIKLFEPPNIILPPDFEKYDPKVTDSVTENVNGVKGRRIYNYTLIPRHEGNYTIEPLKFAYFNPATNSYVTLSTKAFQVKVNKGIGGGNVTSYSGADKQDVKMLNKDIRFIKTNNPDLYKAGDEFYGSALFYLLLALGPLLFIGALAYRKWDEQNNSDLVKVKSRKANKIAAKHLENASRQLQAGDKKQFYEAIFRGLYGYLSDKLNIPAADLNKEKISGELKLRGVDDELVGQLNDTLDMCEMARFAPVSTATEQQVFDQAKSMINDIENKI